MTTLQPSTSTPSDDRQPSVIEPPDPEVSDRPRRRTFTAEYRLAVLKEADACTKPGEIGALLRREGLYHSHLIDWRRPPYGYVAGNPLNRTDPSGNESVPPTASGSSGDTQWQYRYDPNQSALIYQATNPAAGTFSIKIDRSGVYQWYFVSTTGGVQDYNIQVGTNTNGPSMWDCARYESNQYAVVRL